MSGVDLRIALTGIAFVAVGVLLGLLDYLSGWSWIWILFPYGITIAGFGMLYIAFSKKYRTEP